MFVPCRFGCENAAAMLPERMLPPSLGTTFTWTPPVCASADMPLVSMLTSWNVWLFRLKTPPVCTFVLTPSCTYEISPARWPCTPNWPRSPATPPTS